MASNLRIVFVISAALAVFAHEQAKKPKSCEVARFKTQLNFNLSQFMGEWHVISDKGIFPHQHKLDKLVNVFTNIRIYGVLKDSHQVEINLVSRIMGICTTSKMVAERPNFKFPAKLEVSGPEAWVPYMKEVHPVWVVWTDGDAALLYSCGKEAEDGTCDPHHTHSWTLNRHTEGHSELQEMRMNHKIAELCMDPEDFKEMKRSWPCTDFDVEALEAADDDDQDDDDTPGEDAAADDGADDGEGGDEAAEGEEGVEADQEEDLTAEDEEAGGEEEGENAQKAEL